MRRAEGKGRSCYVPLSNAIWASSVYFGAPRPSSLRIRLTPSTRSVTGSVTSRVPGGGQLGDYAPGQRDVRRKAAVFQLKAPRPQFAREPALVRGQCGIVRSPGPPDVAAVPPETPGAVDDQRERPPAGCGHGLCGGRDPGLRNLAQEGQGEMQVRVLREAAAAACQLPQALAGGEQGF